MSDKNTEIAVNEGFAVLANQNVLNEALADDCQGLEFSFDRVKLPAGGGTAFDSVCRGRRFRDGERHHRSHCI